MDTADPRDQLRKAQGLAAATRAEAARSPWWAWPTIGVGAALFFSLFAFDSTVAWTVGSIAWTLFVVAWVVALRRNARVLARWLPSSRRLTLSGAIGTA